MGEEFNIASLGNNILGVFGMMGRIGENVRENPVSLYCRSALVHRSRPSHGRLSPASTLTISGEPLISFSTSSAVYLRFKEEPDNSRTQMIGRLPLSFETNPRQPRPC